MNRTIVALSLTLVLAISTLSGCQWLQSNLPILKPSADRPKEVVIYFVKEKGTKTVTEAVVRPVPADTKDPVMAVAMKTLLQGPNSEEQKYGFYSEIPQGTQLLGVTETDKSVRINLSKEFLSGGGAQGMQQRYGELEQTIRSVEKTRPVYIDVEGKPLTAMGGEGLEVKQPIEPKVQ